jgi:sn-glycerol 3-phosphate transport system permease protein
VHLIPTPVTWSNYVTAAQKVLPWRFLLNGVAISAGGVLVLQLLTVIPAAFAFARLEFPGRDLMSALVLAALVVPGCDLDPELPAAHGPEPDKHLLGPHSSVRGLAFGIFLMRQFFRQIPWEILDAASSTAATRPGCCGHAAARATGDRGVRRYSAW